jgi:hypothetical protein
MYVLIRIISPYTSHDILLGCYRSREEAQVARQQYILQYQSNRKDDPWKEQGYTTVDLEKDVVIVDDIPEIQIQPTNEEVFVVSSFAEGFGQIIRTFHAICGSLMAAWNKSKEIKEKFDGHFPEYCQIQKVVVGKLLSDEETRPYSDIL